jgi:transcriptional regulator
MYAPRHYRAADTVVWDIVEDAGAGLFTISGTHGLETVLTPIVVSADRTHLSGHVAKANSWWQHASNGCEVLGVFLAASAYESPRYYVERDDRSGNVPTWDYVAAEVRGTLTIHHDPTWIVGQVNELQRHFEQRAGDPWTPQQHDREFAEKILPAIVGFEVSITDISGVTKLGQTRREDERRNVEEAFREGTTAERSVARWWHRA